MSGVCIVLLKLLLEWMTAYLVHCLETLNQISSSFNDIFDISIRTFDNNIDSLFEFDNNYDVTQGGYGYPAVIKSIPIPSIDINDAFVMYRYFAWVANGLIPVIQMQHFYTDIPLPYNFDSLDIGTIPSEGYTASATFRNDCVTRYTIPKSEFNGCRAFTSSMRGGGSPTGWASTEVYIYDPIAMTTKIFMVVNGSFSNGGQPPKTISGIYNVRRSTIENKNPLFFINSGSYSFIQLFRRQE